MRRRRNKRNIYIERESRKIIYISILVVALSIISFIIIYAIYRNTISNRNKIGEFNKLTELSLIENKEFNTINSNSEETSKSLGKTINEIIDDNVKETQKDNSVVINTSNIIKKEIKDEVKKPEVLKDPTFIKPVEGKIIRDFAIENLVYSDTLKEWITHTGIDIKADEKTIVKASADGIIKSITEDPRYGLTIVIEHINGFKSVYSNLLTAEFVKEGESIKQGQTIGTVGKTASYEVLDDSHLHFELLKDGGYLNPLEYIK